MPDKTLDSKMALWPNDNMAKHIIAVAGNGGIFRIVIPKSVVLAKRWADAKYILLEDQHPDKLVLRRFVDGESLKDKD